MEIAQGVVGNLWTNLIQGEEYMNSIDNFLKEKLAGRGNIVWVKPNLSEEVGEYTQNDYTKQWLKSKGIVFNTDKEVMSFLNSGKMTSVSKDELMKKYDNLTLEPSEFKQELKDQEYLKSFKSMEDALLRRGSITLPAPIIFLIDGTYYGFAGNRRLNLAIKHDIPIKVWLVRLLWEGTN
jgi:hypothetical protein